MEATRSRSKPGRREIRSVCMPVPAIILNDKSDHGTLPHSRSTGELDMSLSDLDQGQRSLKAGKSLSGVVNSTSESDSRSAIDLYCSPRMPRRSFHADVNCLQGPLQSGMVLDSADTSHSLDPGSRVGSTVSLNSEYTARSVGLISNDSCDSNYPHSTLIDSVYQKHGVLKRFYSTPEKDEDLLQEQGVRRDSKSYNNLQGETAESFACFEVGSDSTGTDDQPMPVDSGPCQSDICDSLSKKFLINESDISNGTHLVTAITGDPSLRDGRIRKWLTEITDPDENSS